MKKITLIAWMILSATQAQTETQQPYAGQETRAIASLTQSDIEALLAGKGWGLALPAELNGYPGPAHVLESANELAMTEDQISVVEAIFEKMQTEAKRLGGEYVDAENHLSMMFRNGHVTPESLQLQLTHTSDILAELRVVHLSAHMDTTPVLTQEQLAKYAMLRGYDEMADGSQETHQGHSSHE